MLAEYLAERLVNSVGVWVWETAVYRSVQKPSWSSTDVFLIFMVLM